MDVPQGSCNWEVYMGSSAKGYLNSKGPKDEQKYFCISALVSKKRSNQKNKGTLY